MKFVHIADMHFDAPFTILSQNKSLGDLRRIEQRQAFKKVIDYIKQESIPYLFISGDLYENEYIKKTTIEYINNLFKEIPNTKVFISPGNHDPILKNSYYNNFNWAENVKIFKNEIEKYEDEFVSIYGYGFNDFTNFGVDINNINIDTTKINILVMHGSIDTSKTLEIQYNPIKTNELKEKKFDYVALGHIHKTNYKDNTNIIYPGSTVSLGFDELGEHGMIVGDIEKNKLQIEFKKLDDREFIEHEIDISNMFSKEELVQIINEENLKESNMYKLILVGKRNFEINISEIQKSIVQDNVIKIKDRTKLGYNLEELSKEQSLKGIFVKTMLEKLNSGKFEPSEIEKAIEIGLEVL